MDKNLDKNIKESNISLLNISKEYKNIMLQISV